MHADKLKFAGSLQGHIMIRMPGARIDEDLIKRFSIYSIRIQWQNFMEMGVSINDELSAALKIGRLLKRMFSQGDTVPGADFLVDPASQFFDG